MLSRSILRREEDGKLFRVTFLSHWSDIKANDGEVDSVKCYGPALYVSANKGFGYVDITDRCDYIRHKFERDFVGADFRWSGGYTDLDVSEAFSSYYLGYMAALKITLD